jgi:hypothetical protein
MHRQQNSKNKTTKTKERKIPKWTQRKKGREMFFLPTFTITTDDDYDDDVDDDGDGLAQHKLQNTFENYTVYVHMYVCTIYICI